MHRRDVVCTEITVKTSIVSGWKDLCWINVSQAYNSDKVQFVTHHILLQGC